MKKVLFATTALVAFAGAAAAEVSLDGSANAGIRNVGVGDSFLHYEIDLDIIFSGSTDNGLTFGASMDLDENSASSDPEIFISGAFGTLTIGALDPMIDAIGIGDLGFDGIGIDDDLEALRFSGGSEANVTYVYEGAGFTFGISTFLGETTGVQQQEGDFGILLGYETNGFHAEIAYDYNDSLSADSIGLELGYSDDMYAVTFIYIDGAFGEGYGLHGSYTMDALTISAAFADDGGINDYGLGASYALGGGLSIAGAVGSRNDLTVWDLGLNMSF